MKIFVTGGTGFIGQYLLRCEADEHQFVVAGLNEDYTKLYNHKNISYVDSDFSVDSLCNLMQGCDGVVHLAAVRPTKEIEKSFKNYYINITLAEDVFTAAQICGIKNIVNISSRMVYNSTLPMPYKEERIATTNLYSIAKLTCEQLGEFFNSNKDMCIKSLRVAQVIGYGEREGNMLSVFLKNCLEGKKLCIYGEGKQARDYIYVKDVIYGIMCALKNPSAKGIFNLGSGVATSNYEIAQLYCEVFENPEGVERLLDKPEDALCTMLDMSKTNSVLGFYPQYTFKAALEDIKHIIECEVADN